MRQLPSVPRALVLAALGVGAGLWYGCADQPTGPEDPPSLRRGGSRGPDVQAAIAAQERHNATLFRISGVVGTAVGRTAEGRPTIQIFLERAGVRGLPTVLDDFPVTVKVTGPFMAITDPTTRERPAPVGFSVGHPDITAGTIGARVRDASNDVYVLSNNHVLAASNEASIGDPALQPGPFDGGTLSDQIGTLSAFEVLDFSGGQNTIDAAIAVSSTTNLGSATPSDDGYGAPSSQIFGDANGNGVFDDVGDLLGLNVQKYGRTTKLTKGQITGINASLDVCYEVMWIFCTKLAHFTEQLVIGPSAFSDGGDSGSLIVTDDANAQPVGLLFAGSDTETIANRIDFVLNHFDVTVDGEAAEPPPDVTDVATTSVGAPADVLQGDVADVSVTVHNVGNQDVASSFDVTLEDATDAAPIGTETVTGLTAGASTTVTFTWNTAGSSIGSHTLVGRHTLTDDDASNDEAQTTVQVNDPTAPAGIHVGDLDGFSSNDGSTWSATVEVTVHDASHNPINGATVTGFWDPAGLASDECTTGELGGNGTCIFLFPGIQKRVKSVTFTVTNISMPDESYEASLNHDVDGSSDGTSVTVNR